MSSPAPRPDQPRRFFKAVAVAPQSGGFALTLDGRTAKTPAGAPLIAPTQALANLLAEEWAAQGEQIDFAAMPATRLAFTAIDRTPGAHGAMALEIERLTGADNLCYFAHGPESLVERQERLWGPWLAWVERDLGLVLIRAKGVNHQRQPAETLARAKWLATEMDDFTLSALVSAAGLYGSVVLAFAVWRGALSAEAAFELSRLDEAFQEERWGEDGEAAVRTGRLREDAAMIGAWFSALGKDS